MDNINMDIYDKKNIKPMLIADMKEPFDSADYIYEVKWDGIRCISYLDNDTDIRNIKNKPVLSIFPELEEIHKQIKYKCILDHELVVLKNSIPDFYEVSRRLTTRNQFKIKLAADKFPASIIAYDILYYKDRDITMLPLVERKKYLEEVLIENDCICFSRYVECYGIQLFELVKEKGLEGIVAKRKDSKYWSGKKTKEWIKSKVLNTEDCVICGYIIREKGMTSFVIAQYDEDELIYQGHVSLGSSLRVLNNYKYEILDKSPLKYTPKGHENTVWIEPKLVCIIESMPTDRDGYRRAVFKGIRNDKYPIECQIKKEY